MFNIEQFLIDNKIEYRKEGKNVSREEVNICCPFCEEGRYHLGISSIKDKFHCWICSKSGNIILLISKLKNISYLEARVIVNPQNDLKRFLEERQNKKMFQNETLKQNKDFKLPEYSYPFQKDKTNIWQRVAYKFIQNKYGLIFDDIIQANLHYCNFGKYKNCIIIPCYFQNKLVNFIARSWDINGNKRYLNCPNEESLVNTKHLVYNYDNIKKGQYIIIITEGCFDTIKVGLNRSIALCGTEITQEQINLIVQLKPKNIIIMFDNDPHLLTTDKKAQKLADYLSAFTKTKTIKLPYGKDPADLTKEEIEKLLC